MNATEKELKSCPFCGGKGKIEHIDDTNLCYAICTKCYATAQGFLNYPGSNGEEKSVHAWNRRVGELPTVDVQEIKHGEWREHNKIYICSQCGYSFENEGYIAFFNYCPNCGARMDGEGK